MPLYAVSYDLLDRGRDYTSFVAALQSVSPGWCHSLDRIWFIDHPGPAKVVHDALVPHLAPGDRLLVVRVIGDAAWHDLADSAADWIRRSFAAAPQ